MSPPLVLLPELDRKCWWQTECRCPLEMWSVSVSAVRGGCSASAASSLLCSIGSTEKSARCATRRPAAAASIKHNGARTPAATVGQ
ncbi:hypothetical protein VZT92_021032 [Zoarces viviparus]|uniref:Uncharacterized protein n=1 Tax=Zoarces viviparus TaxID=48416 RepID=A0AAW1EG96_ZOAVI